MKEFAFQVKAIDQIKQSILTLWKTPNRQIPIVFKSPTGSGKTYMMAEALNGLVGDPQTPENIAYIWITFSDSLAMQSKDKFQKYFGTSIKNDLLSLNDINSKQKLLPNSILFINWQKLVSNQASDRQLKLRRPDSQLLQKESGLYFEDFIEKTHSDNIDIALVIDESHKNATTNLAQDIIDIIDPKLIIDVSATPKYIPTLDDIEDKKAGYIRVKHPEVVEAGLIREKILLQSKDELIHTSESDLDLKLLELGMKRRILLKEEYQKIGKDINPLMLIQLPNDDQLQKEQGLKTKEEIVLEFFKEKNVDIDKQVAFWFDGREVNMNHIDYFKSDVDFMLFKQAAGTGWDCPRAQVLVMFREIKGSVFYIQTLGRILRMTEPGKSIDYNNTPLLRQGYLYTNYHRDEVEVPGGNETKVIQCTEVKECFIKDIENLSWESETISRVDYGDLVNAVEFQKSFITTLNDFFDLPETCLLNECEIMLEKKGIQLQPSINSTIITNMEISDYDTALDKLKTADESVIIELSNHDIEKLFNISCIKILEDQTSTQTKVGNISRSWGTLKSSIRLWFKKTLPNRSSLEHYKIFIEEISKGPNSIFRKAIIASLKNYYPIKKQLLKDREEILSQSNVTEFNFDNEWCFDSSYSEIKQKKYLLYKFYLKQSYQGKENEIGFSKFLDENEEIQWWYKNGDSGSQNFSLRYFNTTEQQIKLFYPDWIIRFKDGRIGILDTKGGSTLNTEGRAKGLQRKLQELGGNFVGGIVKSENGTFYICTDEDYNDVTPSENKWLNFDSL